MLSFLVEWSFWMWFVLGLVVTTLVNYDNGKAATGILFAFCAIWFGTHLDVFYQVVNYVKNNPATIVVYSVIYLTVGVLWSFGKLYFKAKEDKEQGRQIKNYSSRQKIGNYVPTVSDYKEDIFRWISYWPLSMIWFLFDSPLRRFINFVINMFSGLYQSLINSVYKSEDTTGSITETE